MNKLQSNDLNVIVNLQYGIGFELIEGKVEIEITIFNKTQNSRAITASRNRLNFYEEFIWKIDRMTLKYYLTTNEMVKIECFTMSNAFYGSICRRQRIGHKIIKLKEFQIIGRDWDQNVSVRGYKLHGISNYCEIRLILIIQEEIDVECSKIFKRNIGIDKKNYNSTNENKLINGNKQDSIIQTNKCTNINLSSQQGMNKYQTQKVKNYKINNSQYDDILNKQELEIKETLNKCKDTLKHSSIKENKSNKLLKKGTINNELNTMTKKVEKSIKDSKNSLKINEYKFNELMTTCLKHTEECIKIMKKIQEDFDKLTTKEYSSNSSIYSENDLEKPIVMKEIKKEFNDLTYCMINLNEKIKNSKHKCSREMSKLKNTNNLLSDLCDRIAWKINNDDLNINEKKNNFS